MSRHGELADPYPLLSLNWHRVVDVGFPDCPKSEQTTWKHLSWRCAKTKTVDSYKWEALQLWNLGWRAMQRNPLSSPDHGDVRTARVRLRKGRSILEPLAKYTQTYPSCSATKKRCVPSSAWIIATGLRSPLATSCKHNSRQPLVFSRTEPRLAFSSVSREKINNSRGWVHAVRATYHNKHSLTFCIYCVTKVWLWRHSITVCPACSPHLSLAVNK